MQELTLALLELALLLPEFLELVRRRGRRPARRLLPRDTDFEKLSKMLIVCCLFHNMFQEWVGFYGN